MRKTKVQQINRQATKMEKIKFLKAGSLADVKANLKGIVNRYESSSPWIDEFFAGGAWSAESVREIDTGFSLKLPQGQELFDLENTKALYTALRDLPLHLAIDERFWSYMTHVTFWDYMRARWPVEKALSTQKPEGYLREHYFFMANRDRALIRNGISRLWWYGHVSYDENREDPFELTEAMLEKLDIAQQLLERSYSRNTMLTRTILSMLVEKRNAGNSFSDRYTKFRPLMGHLNAIGGVTILDALVEADIRAIVETKLSQIDLELQSKTENPVTEPVVA